MKMPELDLTKAIQIGAEALADCDGSKYPLSYVEPMREALKDCLPHILDALIERAERDVELHKLAEGHGMGNLGFKPRWADIAALWLKELAMEARNA
jgi:hypothetical protein